MNHKTWQGAGLGYRRPYAEQLIKNLPQQIDFLELAPENWIRVGGARKKKLVALAEHYPIICHGLSLSIGGPAPLDFDLLKKIKHFLDEYQVSCYSEHLSYSNDGNQLYDLLPIPFTQEAVYYVADRIRQVQDFLERPLAIENVSFYCAPSNEMNELDFINEVLTEADCELLLDVNNIYVNSVNHQYNAKDFLQSINPKKVAYIHVAGHDQRAENLIIDSHGAPVIDPVWQLLELAYQRFGNLPTLLERDTNLPPLDELLIELEQIKSLQQQQVTADECFS